MSKFIEVVIQSIDQLKNIFMMKPLLDWMKFVKLKFDGKIKKDESLDMSITEVLATLNRFEQEEGERLFAAFTYSWNRFAQSAENTVREGCDEI